MQGNIAEQLKLYEIGKPQGKKHRTPEEALIDEFMEEINLERPPGSFYIKNGKKKKLEPMTFIGTRMKLLAIANDKKQLELFLRDCRDYKNRGKLEGKFENTFSRRFFGGFLNTFENKA